MFAPTAWLAGGRVYNAETAEITIKPITTRVHVPCSGLLDVWKCVCYVVHWPTKYIQYVYYNTSCFLYAGRHRDGGDLLAGHDHGFPCPNSKYAVSEFMLLMKCRPVNSRKTHLVVANRWLCRKADYNYAMSYNLRQLNAVLARCATMSLFRSPFPTPKTIVTFVVVAPNLWCLSAIPGDD